MNVIEIDALANKSLMSNLHYNKKSELAGTYTKMYSSGEMERGISIYNLIQRKYLYIPYIMH